MIRVLFYLKIWEKVIRQTIADDTFYYFVLTGESALDTRHSQSLLACYSIDGAKYYFLETVT
jgi:hypothetical protein